MADDTPRPQPQVIVVPVLSPAARLARAEAAEALLLGYTGGSPTILRDPYEDTKPSARGLAAIAQHAETLAALAAGLPNPHSILRAPR